MKKHLYRSKNNKVIGGVCGGIAEYFDTDPTLIRLVWAFLAFYGGVGVMAYIVCLIIVPEGQQGGHRAVPANSKGEQNVNPSEAETAEGLNVQTDTSNEKTSTSPKIGDRSRVFAGVFLICIGGLLLLKKLLHFNGLLFFKKWLHFINFNKYWPVLLIIAGLVILLKETGKRGKSQ